MSLQRGSEVAMQWIASEYAKAGLRPVVGDSFIQPVPLIEYRMDRDGSGLTVERGGKKSQYRFPDAYGYFPYDVTVRAPVVFAGYGITAPELNYDDYAGIDVRGKIVLVFDHEPQENDAASIFNGTGNTRYASSHVKALNAQKHGAVAVLTVAEPNRKHPSPQERMARVTSTRDRARIPSQAIDGDDVHIPLYTVSDAIATELIAAGGRKPGEIQSAIDAKLQPHSMALPGVEATLCSLTRERRRASSGNVLGMIEGGDPVLKNETVIYTAHFDHNGVGPNGVFHGADDNGSGTVGVVALAHAFARNPARPKRTIVFAVFAAEERGLLGSYYYTEHPPRPLATTRAVINFDMIGRNETPSEQTKGLIEIAPDTSNELNLIGTKYAPAYRRAVERLNENVGLRLSYKWDDEAALNIFFRSDQFPFTLHDVPAIWWFTAFHPDYHQVTDTVDRINFPKMEKIVRLAYLAGWEFGDTANPPRFIENPAAPARQ